MKLTRWLLALVAGAGFALAPAPQAFAGDDADADSACKAVITALARGSVASSHGDDADADGLGRAIGRVCP